MASRMLLTINMRRYLVTQPRTKRKYKAIKYIRERVSHFTKTNIDDVLLSQELNVMILKSYANRMAPIRLAVKIDGGKATAEPFKEDVVKEEKKEEKKEGRKEAQKAVEKSTGKEEKK